MTPKQWKYPSPVGTLYLLANEKALVGLHFRPQRAPFLKDLKGVDPATKILHQCVEELKEYFEGRRKNFSVPLGSEGTSFQKEVWSQLRKIPFGETRSYRDIAKSIKNPKAFRAVGTANGRNPLSIIVPCHRVIAADGSLGGFGGGLKRKLKLLQLEKAF